MKIVKLEGRVFTDKQVARFWRHVDITEGCWVWKGARSHYGYGRLRVPGDSKHWVAAHRMAWYLTFGKDAEVLDHEVCDNPPCVNPSHMSNGTQSDNIGRAYLRRGRFMCGHPYTEENTLFENNGKLRRCKTCRRKQAAEYSRARRAQRGYVRGPYRKRS